MYLKRISDPIASSVGIIADLW